jgi:hypothetical protein
MRVYPANYLEFPTVDVINPATYALGYNLS